MGIHLYNFVLIVEHILLRCSVVGGEAAVVGSCSPGEDSDTLPHSVDIPSHRRSEAAILDSRLVGASHLLHRHNRSHTALLASPRRIPGKAVSEQRGGVD